MKERIFETVELLGDEVANEICGIISGKPDALICIAGGDSSRPVFAGLIKRKWEGFDFSRLRFVAMDEWLGMNARDAEGCGGFLLRHFLEPMGIGADRYRLFDGKAPDLATECASVERYISQSGGIDYILLGIGMNGHIALNEPGCNLDSGAYVTELSETTKNVGQKYFSVKTALSGGVTLGMKNIRDSRDIVMAVQGEHKCEMVRRLKSYRSVDPDFPASALTVIPQARLYMDRDAAR